MLSPTHCFSLAGSFRRVQLQADRLRLLLRCQVIQFLSSRTFHFQVKLVFNFHSHIVSGPRLWRPSPMTNWSQHNCAFFISFDLFRLHFSLIMNDSFRIEFQSARASIERHGPQLPFQLPWEKGVWKRIFSHPNFNSNSFQPHSSKFHVVRRVHFMTLLRKALLCLQSNFGQNFSIVQIFNKDVLMDYAILLFPGLFQCLLPPLVLLCF